MVVASLMLLLAASPVAAEKSCLADVGKVRAQAYVDMCVFFSTATRPPCNVANACAVMQAQIDSTCTDKAKCVVPTVDGSWKCKDDACSSFSFTAAKPKRR